LSINKIIVCGRSADYASSGTGENLQVFGIAQFLNLAQSIKSIATIQLMDNSQVFVTKDTKFPDSIR
jgi:hypothetical protein